MATAGLLTQSQDSARDDFEDKDRYEIIDGVRVELPPMSTDSAVLASRLSRHLSNFGIENDLGEAYPEVLFKLPLPVDRNRKPDVAFVPYHRWPRKAQVPATNAWDVLPDLCVEVVSPNDLADEIMDKVREYFQSGVRLVWVFYPRHDLVHIYESLTTIRVLTRTDTLEGGSAVPGFKLPLAELFPASPPLQST